MLHLIWVAEGANILFQDSKPKGIVKPSPPSKIHQIHYANRETGKPNQARILAVSTEDGRILFYSTNLNDSEGTTSSDNNRQIPLYPTVGELGGDVEGSKSRIKDFEMLNAPGSQGPSLSSFIVTASSEGSIVLWALDLGATLKQLSSRIQPVEPSKGFNGCGIGSHAPTTSTHIGRLLGRYETGNRITCLKAFIMTDVAEENNMSVSMLDDGVDANGGLEGPSDDSSD